MSDGTTGGAADLGLEGYDDYHEIGQGGFSVVYRAHQRQFGSTVAIKVINGVVDEQAQARFERECRTMGALRGHPNIVTVFDAGRLPDGRAYLVMEYLAGGSLADRLASQPFTWQEATAIGVKVAGALDAAHKAGVLHRDIKPENIFVSSYGEPKLGDFGIARLEGGPATRSGMFTASIAHAPPEIIDGKGPTEAADVYSLASTVFALLNGKPAFAADTDESIVPMLARIATQPLPDLRPLGVPDAVCAVIEQGMAKDPAERIPTADELGRRLREASEAAASVTPAATPPVAPHTAVTPVPPPPPVGRPPAGQLEHTAERPAGPPPPPPSAAPHASTPPPPPAQPAQATAPAPGAPPPPTAPPATAAAPAAPVVDAPAPASRRRSPMVAIGIVAAVVVLLIVAGVVVALSRGGDSATTTSTSTTAADDRDAGATTVGLEPGTCVAFPELERALVDELTAAEREAAELTTVDCAEAHDLEVFHNDEFFDGPDVPYPGDEALEGEAQAFCANAFQEYVGTPAESSSLQFFFEYPDEQDWEAGERRYTCSAFDPNFDPLTGSVAGSGR